MLDDYMGRVANVLDADTPEVSPYEGLQPLPDRRDRRAPTEELRAGLLESIKFRQCDLLPLIAERNSSLGKVMPPSKRVSYELRFFARLAPCYKRMAQTNDTPLSNTDASVSRSGGEDFLTLLENVYRVKSANLEAELWNGVMLSEEMEMQFSLSREPLPLEGNPTFSDSLRALQVFNKLQQRVEDYRHTGELSLPAELATLEDHYFALYSSYYGAQLLKSLALLSSYLNAAAGILEQAIADRPLCFNERPTPQADILQNVFFNYYAGKVQPYMSQVQRQGELWLEQLATLMQPPNLEPPQAMQRYYEEVWAKETAEGLWQDYQAALKRHTQAWQDVLGQCGLMPKG